MDIREKIARESCRLDGWCLESLNPQYISPQYNNPTQSDYYRKADQILALIKEAGYVQLLPDSAIMENVSLLKNIGKQNEKEV